MFVYRKVTVKRLFGISLEVARVSAVVLFIIAAANLFGWILASEDIPQKVANFILSISTNYWIVLLLFNLLLLVLGMFMETIAIIIIVLPIFSPIMSQLGMDPIHLGVMVCVNLAIGANTPPLGVDLIAACKIANVRYEDSFRFLGPFLGAMALILVLMVAFPPFVTWIPDLFIK
jgi:tripartite ATP-independent transporter DctM subunit